MYTVHRRQSYSLTSLVPCGTTPSPLPTSFRLHLTLNYVHFTVHSTVRITVHCTVHSTLQYTLNKHQSYWLILPNPWKKLSFLPLAPFWSTLKLTITCTIYCICTVQFLALYCKLYCTLYCKGFQQKELKLRPIMLGIVPSLPHL